MNERRSHSQHPEDLPWNDVPADSDVIPGTEEPDPAEVLGDDNEEYDQATPRHRDLDDTYHRDTLSERLTEEEPESRLGRAAESDPEFQGAEPGGYVLLAETEDADQQDAGPDELPAEDAAIHVTKGE
jgi:hypothetical protein